MPPQQQQRDQQSDGGSERRGPNPLVCEMFQGINTATTRAGVPDAQMFWCDGFIPLAPRNLRVLPGIGAALYTPGGGKTIVCFYFYNLGSTPYAVVFLSDGSVVQVRTTDGATTQILPALTINGPSITTVGVAQYGSQYLLIAASHPSNPGSGYWVWDGNLVYGAGTLAPIVTLTNPGSAYVSAPNVVISGGSGMGATGSASVADGVVTNVVLTNPGTGYLAGDLPKVTLVGGQQTGSGASLTAHISLIGGGTGASLVAHWNLSVFGPGSFIDQLTSITISNGGTGYSSSTTASFVGTGIPGFWVNGGVPTINLTVAGGVITGVSFTPAGSNPNAFFNNQNDGDPTVQVTDPSSAQYTVTSVTGTPTGTNYSPSTIITASGGGAPVTQATITPVITAGVITGVNIVSGGIYGSNTAPTLAVTDTAVTATATISLMPFGVGGNAIETYAGHVWVANGPLIEFSAPGSVSDFSTANGGGSFTSSDSFLRVGFTRLINTNGFLFLIGDSSMNYISGVQTITPSGGGSPTTTFTNNNSDPETGTPYPASVVTIGQDIFIANQNGIYVSSGGTFVKESEMLDGVYNSAPGVFNGLQLSAAKALIFGKLVWMVLVPITDPVLNTTRNKLFMFNQQHKYWWSSEQDVTLTFIQSQEINSVFQPYGTDGTSIYPLFTTPSTAFTKRFQSRLWDGPVGYDYTKSSVNLFALAQFLGSANLSYNVFIDNESGTAGRGGPYVHSGPSAGPEVFSVMPPTAIGQVGVLTGMTIETTADDLVIASIMMQDEVVQYRA